MGEIEGGRAIAADQMHAFKTQAAITCVHGLKRAAGARA